MIRYEPFRAGHLKYLNVQDRQRQELAVLAASGGAAALEPYTALSAWRDGACIACAGLIPITAHRAVAWALVGRTAGPSLLAVANKVKRVIELTAYRRVEFTVADGFKNGHRFAKALGATLETPEPMKAYGAFGGDEYMYAILKDV